jgi:hypothetical protein
MKPTLFLTLALFAIVPASHGQQPPLAGGFSQAANTDAEVLKAAQFAVKAHDAKLTLQSVNAAEQQVVAGINYKLKLTTSDGRKADAVVWRKLDGSHELTSWQPVAADPALITTEYIYDTENRLSRVRKSGNLIAEYKYDGDGGRGLVLRREDVAARPGDLGAERDERLDEHGRLDRHVQAAGDARALQGLPGGEFLADGHETGHLGLGDLDFLAAPVGKRQVGHGVVGGVQGFEDGVHGEAPWVQEPARRRTRVDSVLTHAGAACR